MRTRKSLVLSLILASAGFAQNPAPAEDPDPAQEPVRESAITVHPAFSLAISGLNISLERPLGQGLWSYEVPFYLGYNEKVYANPYFFAGSGFTLRRYLLERGNGTYFAPSLDLLNVHRFEKGPEVANNLFLFAPNLRMGYRWTWKAFTLDASAGFLYYQSILTQGQRSSDDWEILRGLFPMTQLALGMPF
jgi:hypothetical protein